MNRPDVGQPGRPDIGQPGRPDLGQPGRPSVGSGNLAANRAGRVENRQQWQADRQQRRNEVWDQIEDNYPRLDFWTDYPNWAAWRLNRPYRWATWGALAGWCGYGASEPAYYDYGTSTYYEDGQVYQGGQAVASAEQYVDQAATIATGGPTTDPSTDEWMPLGVFALTQDGQASGATPTLFMQLAVNKQAVISGTFCNKATNQTQQLEGAIDKASQRAAWCVVGQQRPIVETGLANLTQDEAPALVHFADGQTQQWLLVRLKDPQGAE
jgi:hypothetical protein